MEAGEQMIEFRFEVNGQELRRIDRINPAGDVVGQLWAVFDFNDWWEDTFPIARFVKGGIIYDVEIIDNKCLVPYQALSGEGKFYVSVYAIVSNGRKTTNKEVVEYITSGLNLTVPPSLQEGTLWEKIYKSLRGGQTGQIASKASDNDYDFEFIDLPEGGSEISANNTSYDNTISGLNGETVQEAIDELSSSLDNLAGVTLEDVTSWAIVQKIVRAGLADKLFNIGDQFTVMKGSTPLVFDVIGIDHDIPTDSTKTHSMTLQLHDCLTSLQFDAREPTNPNGDRKSYGSNNWLESNLRQWLNATGNDWWSAQTEYDVAPSYAAEAGFLSDIDNEFLSVIGNVKKITTKNTVTDGGGSVDSDEKIFLLSRSEVHGGNENNINEGMAYPYYSDNSSLSSAGTGKDTNRIKYLNDVAGNWWLRSPDTSTAYYANRVYKDGGIGRGISGLDSNGVAPACCII